MADVVRKTETKITFADDTEQTTAGFISKPPSGKYKVVNIYVDPTTGKVVVQYEDTPVP